MTRDEFKKALIELGATSVEEPADQEPPPWMRRHVDEMLEKFQAGRPFTFSIQSERLGRCYHRTTSVTIGGSIKDAPVGNSGGCTLLAEGTHPLLGKWIKTSCEIDSSD